MNNDFDIEISTAWWFMPYVYVLGFLCALMKTEPDEGQFNRVMARAIKLKVVVK